jgi:hypothetical protein
MADRQRRESVARRVYDDLRATHAGPSYFPVPGI